MPPTRPLSVREALSPRSPLRKRARSRITLYLCPICRIRMPALMLDTHIDRCKPPRPRRVPAASPPAPPAEAPTTRLHFLLRRAAPDHPPVCTVHASACPLCADASRAAFAAAVSLRGYRPAPSPARAQLLLHACPAARPAPPHHIPPLPQGSPAARLPPALLKSALQKCVRRRLSQPAVRVAVALLRKTHTIFELLRRLTIIVLEDATLHPHFPTLVWLLAAVSKGYRPHFGDLKAVLRVVQDVAAAKTRDFGTASTEAAEGGVVGDEVAGKPMAGEGADVPEHKRTQNGLGADKNSSPSHNHSIPPENEQWHTLVESLRIRACYGGMPFDQALLHRAVTVWQARFTAQSSAWQDVLSQAHAVPSADRLTDDALRALLREDEPVLRPGDIPPAAWDNHCCAVAEDLSRNLLARGGPVVHRFPGGLDDVKRGIESLMWTHRSGVNVKRPWQDLEGARLTLNGGSTEHKERDESGDIVLWKTEIEPLVNAWCRTHRRRYGL